MDYSTPLKQPYPRDSLEKVEAEMQAEVVAEQQGPVRRRMVTEIVPGVWERIGVFLIDMPHDPTTPSVGIELMDRDGNEQDSGAFTAKELRAAARTFDALADGLGEIGGAK